MRIPFFCGLFFLLIIPFSLWAQEPRMRYRAKKALYLEAGGSGGLTANFDYLTMEIENFKTAIRLGGGLDPTTVNGQRKLITVVPFELLGFIGKSAGHLEGGLGYTHRFSAEPTEPDYYITSRLGLRYQKPRGGFLFRIGYVPLFYKDLESRRKNYTLSPAFALSVGTSF